jgi:ferredoxin
MSGRTVRRRLPGNAEGRYYTTEDCDGCAYCASVAPDNFDYAKETNTYFVCQQPRDTREEEMVLDAADDCPLDAIRVDEVLSYTPVVTDR